MKGVIFGIKDVNLLNKILTERDELNKKLNIEGKRDEIVKYRINFILNTLKSYKKSPNGNGIKWSKDEKQIFTKLSYAEQKK